LEKSNPIPVTAVFDIGKTNKKFFLFDENYSIIQKKQTSLNQTTDEDGAPCEDLALLEYWIKNKLEEANKNKEIDIQALNFSGYGASLVHLDKAGNTVTPLYNYLKPYPEDLFDKFYETYGGQKQVSLQTASPPMGMLNSGLQLFWLKHAKPFKFEEIEHSLHFPQYLSYLVTGECRAELTSIGCHTVLWNFNQERYHRWLEQENCLELLAPISPVSYTCSTKSKDIEAEIGIGIHDSSAALAPYLLGLDNPFLLVSTGTWSITFNPFNKEPLTYSELRRDCLCYLNIYGEQVKASRLFLGKEYEHQKEKINDHFRGATLEKEVELDSILLNKLMKEANPARKLKLEKAYSSGPFPKDKPGDWDISQFDSYTEAYHQLMLDLVSIQAESIKLTQDDKKVDKLIMTGGFSQNDFFIKLLASFFPGKKIYTSSLPNASALGAAMVVNGIEESAGRQKELKDLLGLESHEPVKGLKVKDYSWKESVIT